MKPESLGNRGSNAAVNTFPVLYTTPVTPREFVTPKVANFGASRGIDEIVRSRTAVAVSEGGWITPFGDKPECRKMF